MENKDQKKNADEVSEKNDKSKKEKMEDQKKQNARLAERKGQRPAFPFSRKKLQELFNNWRIADSVTS